MDPEDHPADAAGTVTAELSRRAFVADSIKGAAALSVATPIAAQAAEATTAAPGAEAAAATSLERSFATGLVPGDCEYRVALPPGYRADRGTAYPLLLLLHGGGGSRDFLDTLLPLIEDLWRSPAQEAAQTGQGYLAPCVAVCANAGRSFYMDYRDGSESWETLIVSELLDAVRREFHVAADRRQVAVCGVSMGGMGCLRMGFKHPGVFGTLAALEPAIEASVAYTDLAPADTFYRADQYGPKFGIDGVVDEAYWAANNPATVAANAPERLGQQAILIEAGTEDGFELQRGAEFLHRILIDRGIKHEYRLVLGADHVGDSLTERFRYALAFIGRQFSPGPADEAVVQFRNAIAPLRRQAGLD